MTSPVLSPNDLNLHETEMGDQNGGQREARQCAAGQRDPCLLAAPVLLAPVMNAQLNYF